MNISAMIGGLKASIRGQKEKRKLYNELEEKTGPETMKLEKERLTKEKERLMARNTGRGELKSLRRDVRREKYAGLINVAKGVGTVIKAERERNKSGGGLHLFPENSPMALNKPAVKKPEKKRKKITVYVD